MVQLQIRKPIIRNALVIGLCFLLASTGYLAWVYNLMDLLPQGLSDVMSLSTGYAFQALGIGFFALFLRRGGVHAESSLYFVPAVYMLFLVPAVLGTSLLPVLLFGFLQNLLCGWIAGYYLYRLTAETGASSNAAALGIGYGSSVIASWLLSLIGKGTVYYSNGILVICLVLTAAVIIVIRLNPMTEGTDEKDRETAPSYPLTKGLSLRSFLLLAGGLILLFSIVNSCGFAFPSADVRNGINLEFSRLFYAAGLLIAGFVNDKNRKSGAICALAALVIPFIMLALRGEPVSVMIFWALSYFTFGFYSVYRMILFSDIARGRKLLYLSGFGLLIGRVGDAAGEVLNLSLSDRFLILIVITALLFVAAVILFFRVYPFLYLPKSEQQMSEREKFNYFSARHDLSAREREVLRLLLQEKTNAEIADILYISEGTVKYHIHNLLQKTGCKNRIALLSAWSSGQDEIL